MVQYTPQKQTSIEAFELPFPGKLDPANRWVRYTELIPWDDLVTIYVKSMNRTQGKIGVDPRVAIGAILVKHLKGLSDEETLMEMQENVYVQYFLGFPGFRKDLAFDPSLLVHIRRRMGAEGFARLNDRLLEEASRIQQTQKEAKSRGNKGKKTELPEGSTPVESNPEVGSQAPHQGILKLDATVADQAIRYPTDVSLLNECRQKSEELIDRLYLELPVEDKPRTYRKLARQDYLAFSKKRKKSKRQIQLAIGKQLRYLRRNLKSVDTLLDTVEDGHFPLYWPYQRMLWVIREVYRQQMEKYRTQTTVIPDRIVSVHQPHVRPMVRGKAGAEVEFGAKVNASEVNGFARADVIRWDAYNEAGDLKVMVESYRDLYGCYPEYVVADRIYMNRDNRTWLKERGIKAGGPPLGRPSKESKTPQERKKSRAINGTRNHVEGKFGEGKVFYRMNRIRGKNRESSEGMIHAIFFCMNLARLLRVLFAFFIRQKNTFINTVKLILSGIACNKLYFLKLNGA